MNTIYRKWEAVVKTLTNRNTLTRMVEDEAIAKLWGDSGGERDGQETC
jgi:hypothetical protein